MKKIKVEFEFDVPVGTKYIAMDEDGGWWPFKNAPWIEEEDSDDIWVGDIVGDASPLCFASSWRESKRKVVSR